MARPGSRSLPRPDDIHREVLPNGITILTRSNFNSPSVTISGYLPAGSLPGTEDKLGLADFVASALMRGTERRSYDQIYGRLEAVGASLGFDSGTHTTSFGGRSLVEDLPLLVETLAETLRYPKFPDDELEKLRAQLLTGLAIRAQDTADMASLVFGQIIFDGHPYSRPDDGFPDSNDYETEMVITFRCTCEHGFSFNAEEIDDIRFWSHDEIKNAIGLQILSDNFEHEFRTYMEYVYNHLL